MARRKTKTTTAATPPQEPPVAALSAMDERLAQNAREKIKRQETPPKREQDALRRVTARNEELLRQRYYRSVPKKHYLALAGLKTYGLTKLIGNGFPASGKIIDLYEVIRWLHVEIDRLSNQVLEVVESEPASPALERWREEKARLARFDRKEREGDLLSRESVRESLQNMSAILRNLGATIQRHHGAEAHQLIEEAIDDWERDFQEEFGNNGDGHSAR